MSIMSLSAIELGRSIKEKKIGVAEAVREAFAAIEAKDKAIGSFVTVDHAGACRRAEEVQRQIDAGEFISPLAGVPFAVKDNLCTQGLRTTCGSKMLSDFKPTYTAEAVRNLERVISPLAGVPFAVKDNLCTQGLRTTCGSKMLSDFKPTYTAEAVRNLERAGAVLLGKTNMDEFAMGSTTETSAFGVTKNPWDLSHVPGGSSGGSCAAVAAEECSCALGSDTGGSIRQPSSFCGVTGFKPTYGTVSRYGLIAYASSMDTVGPIARNVSDCAAVLEAIASYDKKDATSVRRRDCRFTEALLADVKGLRIGIPRSYFTEELSPEIKETVLGAAKTFEENGAFVEEFDLGLTEYAVLAYYVEELCPEIKETVLGAAKTFEENGAFVEEFDLGLTEYAVLAYYVIACAEASSNLARFDGVKYGHRAKSYEGFDDMYQKTRSEGFGWEVKRRILLGTFVLSRDCYETYYLQSLRARRLIKETFDRAFARYDILLAPTAPHTAPLLGREHKNPMEVYRDDMYTVAANLAGFPAISLPCGRDKQGLPIGVQLMADCFAEKKLIRAAYALEQTRGYERCPFAATT